MAKYATKAKENIFTQARYNAAKFNAGQIQHKAVVHDARRS